ncbi:hypothetical protein OEZ86_007757 [Tetradesmus obliquus]|nr:hypothetical protein OEZ86_007757 [Tetradesmus obliquus]
MIFFVLVDALGLLRSQNENKVLKEELQHWLSLLTKAPFKLPYAELMAKCITGSWRLDVGDGMHGLRNIFTHIIDYLLEDPTLARAMAGANLWDASIQDT